MKIKAKKKERRKRKDVVVMASRRRAMKELSRVTFSPDTTSGGGSPRVSLRGLPKRVKKNILILIKRQKVREVREKKKQKNAHVKKV